MVTNDRQSGSSGSSRSATPINANRPQRTSEDPWDFDLLPAKRPQQQQQQSQVEQDQGDFGFGFREAPKSTTTTKAPEPVASHQPTQQQQQQQQSHGDEFDLVFDNPLSSASNGPGGGGIQLSDDTADDVLGELGRPPSVRPSPQPPSRAPTPSSASATTTEVPPHVLGQLVEMGFGIAEAQRALSTTYNAQTRSFDVQAAAEHILASNVPDQDRPPSRPRSRQQQQQQQQPDAPRPSASPSNANGELNKEQIMAQASALGNSMFKMANSYWKAGHKAVKHAVDERRAAQQSSGAGANGSPGQTVEDGRPRWMRDLPPDLQVDQEAEELSRSKGKERQREHQRDEPPPVLFHDDDDKEEHDRDAGVLPPHPSERQAAPPSSKPQQNQPTPTPTANKPAEPTAPRIYQSSARRKVPQRSQASSPAAQTPSAKAPATPKIIYQRPSIPLPPAAATASAQHRTKGNEHFKLGAYGEAESAYGAAIEVLPDGHLASVLPLNNRANARLKNGNERGTIEDSSAVLRLILSLKSDDVTMQQIDTSVLDADSAAVAVQGLNLREAVGKALGRRAQAYEAAEKWPAALADWQLLVQAGSALSQPAGGTALVTQGIARCRRALEPQKPKPKPKPAPKPRRPAPMQERPSEALESVRAVAAKAEADEAARLASKDTVDTKIQAWKGGKENNLRALVASLDTIVWPELGWKKVGMHELISDNKLKINYMKAIAKLHPDKVCLSPLLSEMARLMRSRAAQPKQYHCRAAGDRRKRFLSTERCLECVKDVNQCNRSTIDIGTRFISSVRTVS